MVREAPPPLATYAAIMDCIPHLFYGLSEHRFGEPEGTRDLHYSELKSALIKKGYKPIYVVWAIYEHVKCGRFEAIPKPQSVTWERFAASQHKQPFPKTITVLKCYLRWTDEMMRWWHEQDKPQPIHLAEDMSISAPVSAKPKPSTNRGDGQNKLIAALTKHHHYANGSCLNFDPVGNNELAKAAGVSPSTASAFFDKKFKGHAKYKSICKVQNGLLAALKLLNDEFAPLDLYGSAPTDTATKKLANCEADE
jgi:hypothetical protein